MENSNNENNLIQENAFDADVNNIELVEKLNTSETQIEENSEPLPENPTNTFDSIDNNTSNCLALTIKEDYKLSLKTKKILHSLKMSFKVFISYVTLGIIKLFI